MEAIKIKLPYDLKIGDKVKIFKITNDSGNATDLYGVEPQLNAWIDCYYFEEFEGVVTFDEKLLMVVVKGKHRNLPLSPDIRLNLYSNDYENQFTKEELEEFKKEYGLENHQLETIIDYVIKLQ